MQWRFYPLKFELMRIFLNCFSLIVYIIGCINRYTIFENPLDTPLLDLKSKSNCLFYLYLTAGNSVHGKNLDCFLQLTQNLILSIHTYTHIYMIYIIYIIYIHTYIYNIYIYSTVIFSWIFNFSDYRKHLYMYSK